MCAGTEIYELFGHTAIRYENPAEGKDLVFNYGIFSFNTPNFVLRFVKGETDYRLGVVPYSYFEGEYAVRGSSVYQQTLNLTDEEKQKIWDLLEENYRPGNRIYRYNYFYDNCTTRARDKIEDCIDGKVVYPQAEEGVTFRDIVHRCTKGNEWDELGIDLCLGSEADVPIDGRKQMFAPFICWKRQGARSLCKETVFVRWYSVRSKVGGVEPEEAESGVSHCLSVVCMLIVGCDLHYVLGFN